MHKLAQSTFWSWVVLAVALASSNASAQDQPQSTSAPNIRLSVEQQLVETGATDTIREHFTLTADEDLATRREGGPPRRWRLSVYRNDPADHTLVWPGTENPVTENQARSIGTVDWDLPHDMAKGAYRAQAELLPDGVTTQVDFVVPFNISVLFTGKLMGYFRVPNLQTGSGYKSESGEPCEFTGSDPIMGASRDAQSFLKDLPNHPHDIMVGTGDNFAPNYFSRVLEVTDDKQLRQKELNSWNGLDWVRYDDPSANTPQILAGHGTIPTDNVACFLSLAGYDAIVPGKHDFYYGPERLRALARFLASIPIPGQEHYDPHFQPVQMLAANLMIKTSWAKDHDPIPDSGKPKLPFTTGFARPKEPSKPKDSRPRDSGKPEDSRSLKIVDFTDGGYALPWTEFVRVTATGWDEGFLKERLKIYLCEAKDDPDRFLTADGSCIGNQLTIHAAYSEKRPDLYTGKGTVHLVYNLSAETLHDSAHPNYAICAYDPGEPNKNQPGQKSTEIAAATNNPYCVRFTIYQSYLQYPDWPADRGTGPNGKAYTNPLPYKLTKDKRAVIFGVVDPKLEEHIGGDNFAWENVRLEPRDSVSNPPVDKRYTTQLAVADPVQSIIQLNDYFEHNNPTFRGVRILLAQMPADEAKQLAEHLPRCARFDVVIAEADDALATPDAKMLIHPYRLPQGGQQADEQVCEGDGSAKDSVKPEESVNGSLEKPPAVVLVPPTHERFPFKRAEAVQMRGLSLVTDSASFWRYRLSGDPVRVELPDVRPVRPAADQFWAAVCQAVYPQDSSFCKPFTQEGMDKDKDDKDPSKKDLIQQLALWSMYKHRGASIALLQERDFYVGAVNDYLADHCTTDEPSNPSDRPKCVALKGNVDFQEVLDRILWKGDFIQLRLVQGSVLKSIMKQSENYAKMEKAAYLPVEETGRALVTLGLQADSKSGGDYLINSKPLDPNELYTVATSDYIALGDTGYSDLAKPPVGDPLIPARPFRHHLIEEIGAEVCKQIPASNHCDPPINPKDYYDQLANQHPNDPRPGNTNLHKLYAWSFLQDRLQQEEKPPNPTEKKLAGQPNWDVSLDQFSVGFTALTHNGSEQTLAERFAGVQNSQVNAKHFHEFDWDADSSFKFFHPRYDVFGIEMLQYYASDTAQVVGPATESQSKNLFSLDSGAYLHLIPWSSKELPQFSAVFSGHFETQVGNPVTSVNLNPVPPSTQSSTLIFHQGRTNLALGRTGLRFEDRKSYIEGGLEGGQTLNSIQAFRVFVSPSASVTCLLQAELSLSKCLNNYNKSNPTMPVTSSSPVQVLRHPQDRYGAYWKIGLTVPFHPKVSYNFQDLSDVFFLSGGDNSADTRFRHQLVHSLKFKVFPSLSFEPTYTLFLYQNKVDYQDLFQQQYSVKITYSFDCSNWQECWHQSQYKKPSQ